MADLERRKYGNCRAVLAASLLGCDHLEVSVYLRMVLILGELTVDDYSMEEFYVRDHNANCARGDRPHPLG